MLVSKRTPGVGAAPKCAAFLGIAVTKGLGPLRSGAIALPPWHVQDTGVIPSGEMGRGARPAIVAWRRRQSGAHGIPLDVREGGPEVIRPSVVVLRVSSVNAAEQHGQRILAVREGDEMNENRAVQADPFILGPVPRTAITVSRRDGDPPRI
jgi:hypothetical protein